ncbi:MAG: glycine cleavage system protein GcvH [Candidatus Hodarchaeales archaeon]|jgi:glycine cleavage system H protein
MSYEIDSNAKYFKEHQWIRVEDDGSVLIGISDYAQKSLKDIVMIEPPEVGDTVVFGEVFASVESVKAVSDVYSPVSGEVIAVNEEVEDEPEKVNEDPYGSWLVRVKPSNLQDDLAKLMSPSEYEEFCA